MELKLFTDLIDDLGNPRKAEPLCRFRLMELRGSRPTWNGKHIPKGRGVDTDG